jgi:aminoglycoside phosphotransferase (APT) family kinase protein
VEDALAAVLAPALGSVTIEGLVRLSAGANRETWSFDAVTGDGERHELIMQRDRAGMERLVGSCAREARVLRHARAGGVPCAEVVVSLDAPNPLERSFTINRRLAGETIARRILRDDEWADTRTAFVTDCANALGAIHRLDPGPVRDDLPELADALELTRFTYDELADPHPTFELAMRWLERNRPEPMGMTVVHGDFRLGNLLLDHRGLAAALDWEIAHIGDPGQDLGWLCVRAWRFGGAGPVGGIGGYDKLLAAYEAATGVAVGLERLRWWEIYGTLRWGVICMQLTDDHRSGRSPSVELATIGRRVVENEYDVLLALREVSQ